MAICRQPCTPFDTNLQHWTEQVSWNYAEINGWSLTQGISAPDVLVHISAFEKESVHDEQCVVTTQLQQEPSVIINVSITMSAYHTIPYTGVVPNMSIEVFRTDCGLVSLTCLRASLISSRNSRYSALSLGCVLSSNRGSNLTTSTSTCTPS